MNCLLGQRLFVVRHKKCDFLNVLTDNPHIFIYSCLSLRAEAVPIRKKLLLLLRTRGQLSTQPPPGKHLFLNLTWHGSLRQGSHRHLLWPHTTTKPQCRRPSTASLQEPEAAVEMATPEEVPGLRTTWTSKGNPARHPFATKSCQLEVGMASGVVTEAPHFRSLHLRRAYRYRLPRPKRRTQVVLRRSSRRLRIRARMIHDVRLLTRPRRQPRRHRPPMAPPPQFVRSTAGETGPRRRPWSPP